MTAQPSQFRRLFTVEEANATLPLVRAICTDLARLSRDVVERRERLANLRHVREAQGRADKRHDLYAEEVAQIEDELESDSRRLHDYVEELRALGVLSVLAAFGTGGSVLARYRRRVCRSAASDGR
jgi:hypothetical protein